MTHEKLQIIRSSYLKFWCLCNTWNDSPVSIWWCSSRVFIFMKNSHKRRLNHVHGSLEFPAVAVRSCPSTWNTFTGIPKTIKWKEFPRINCWLGDLWGMFQGVCWKMLRDDFLQLFRWSPVRDDAGIDIGGMDIAFPEDASEGASWAKVAWKSQGFFSMYEVLVVGLYTSSLI